CLFAANVQPVFAAQGDWPHGPFAPVVVDLNQAIFQVLLQPAPLVEHVVAGLSQFSSRRQLLADLQQPDFESRHDGHTLLLAKVLALLGSQSSQAGISLHLVEMAYAPNHLDRHGVRWGHFAGIDEPPSSVRHATGMDYRRAQFLVDAVTVALQGASEVFQELQRCSAPASHLKIEDYRPRRLAILPKVGPVMTPRLKLALAWYRDFVDLQVRATDQLRRLSSDHRPQKRSGRKDGIGQCFAVQFNLVIFSQDRALPIDRQVLLVFLSQRLDDELIGKLALGHYLRRSRRRGHSLFAQTMGTALFPQDPAHPKPGRF